MMITPTIHYRYVGPSASVIIAKKRSRLHAAQFKSLRLLHRTLRKNVPVSKRPLKEHPKMQRRNPGQVRMKDAIRSTSRGFGVIGGKVFIDTNVCKHAIYYTYGRSGHGIIYPHKPKKALTIVKRSGAIHLRASARHVGMSGSTKYLTDTVRETESRILKMYRDVVGVWVSEI